MKQRNVIILYGPPGVGKLTVAKEFIEIIQNFKLFHVHLLADLLSSLFKTGTKEFADSFTDLWLFLFKKVLLTNIDGLVVTLIYGVQTLEGKKDDEFFSQIIKVAEEVDANIFFIKLECSDIELNKRIQSDSRKQFKKITDIDLLKSLRKKYKIDQKIPITKSIVINTTKLTPIKTAHLIKEKLNIK